MVDELMAPVSLSPEAILSLKDMEPNITILDKEIAKAERAGIDVKDVKARFAAAKTMRRGLLREYGS